METIKPENLTISPTHMKKIDPKGAVFVFVPDGKSDNLSILESFISIAFCDHP
jgi:hypothetical protein